MSEQPLLTQFLTDADTQMRVFDMGRRVTKIALSEFQQFEKGELPYWYPFQQTAWVALLFWHKKDKTKHNIWFLRMPLDETGHIQISTRDDFMHLFISRLNEQVSNAQTDNKNLTHALKDNPYVFKPTQEKMAVFHAKALKTLQQEPSQFFQGALDYMQQENYEHWDTLGIQGIADLCVRSDEKEIEELLLKSLPRLPDPAFAAFCQNLENENTSTFIAEMIFKRYQNESNSAALALNCIRAIANTKACGILQQLVNDVLNNDSVATDPQVLIAISAKAWQCLEDDFTRSLFLNRLAKNSAGQDYFNAVVIDLMFIPGMRTRVLSDFRNPERSDALSNAVGEFFQSVAQLS